MILGSQNRLWIVEKRQEPEQPLLDLVEMIGQRRVEACDCGIMPNIDQRRQGPGSFSHLCMEALLDMRDVCGTGAIAAQAEPCQHPATHRAIRHIEPRAEE